MKAPSSFHITSTKNNKEKEQTIFMKVTSTRGHLENLKFTKEYNIWNFNNNEELFQAQLEKKINE